MANRYWRGGTGTWDTTTTTNWSASSGGAGGASVPTAADSVFFDQAGTYTVTMTGALNCLDITVSAGSVTFATGTTPTLSVAGSMAITAGTTTWSSTGTITFTATTSQTITSGGTAFDCSMTLNGAAGTWTLQDNLTLGTGATNRTFTLTTGTLALGSFTLSTHLFVNTSTSTRTLSFGTGKISLKASTTSTIWNGNSTTGLTVTGSRTVEVTGGGGAAVTKTITVPGTATASTEATALDWVFKDTGGTVSNFSVASTGVRSLEFRAGSGGQSVTFTGGGTLRFYGNMIYDGSGGATTVTFPATAWQAAASSGSWTIDLNGLGTITTPALTFGDSRNSTFGTWTLASNLTLGATLATTLVNGTLALGSFTLSTGRFISTSAQARTVNYGTGQITLTFATTNTVYSVSTTQGVAGTPLVVFTGGGAAQTFTFDTGAQTEANSVSVTLSASAGTVAFTSGGSVNNLILSNNVFTLSNVAQTIYGNFTINGTNPTLTGGTSALTFAATSGTKTITTNGKTLDFPLTFNGIGGTWQVVGTLTVGVTSRAITLTNGTVDFNSQTLAGTFTFVKSTGTSTIQNLSTTVAMPVTGGTLVLGSNVTTGAFSMTVGTIQLVTYAYTTSSITWSGAGAKTFDFGTSGKFVVNSNATATIISGVTTGFTVSGTTPLIETTGGSTTITKTVNMGAQTEATSIGLSILETAGTVTYAFTTSVFRDFKIDSVAATTIPNIAATIYGNFTFSTTNGSAALTAGTNAWTFAATSGVDTITTNGKTLDFPITFNGVGGTWSLQDALTIGSSRLMTLTNGTLDLNGFTCSVGTFATGVGTKNITFDSGTLTIVGSGATAFNNANPTGFTTSAGTNPGFISLTSASAKTFVGGSSNYSAKLNQGGAGALTVTGSNTLDDITNSYNATGATTITFTAATTQTLSSFTATGSVGRLLTINSSSAGSQATLSKASGIVGADYLSLQDSAATGGATWYAGANSTNVSNNTGWIFAAAPAAAFFMLF